MNITKQHVATARTLVVAIVAGLSETEARRTIVSARRTMDQAS